MTYTIYEIYQILCTMIDYGDDVGMSRAFGKQDDCGYNKYRKPQILIMHKDKQLKKNYFIKF